MVAQAKTFVDEERAKFAQHVLGHMLAQYPWLRGFSLIQDKCGGSYGVRVHVQRMSDEVRRVLPRFVHGVPVDITVVGDPHQQTGAMMHVFHRPAGPARLTLSAPGVEIADGEVLGAEIPKGMAYEDWWWAEGKDLGEPYQPPPTGARTPIGVSYTPRAEHYDVGDVGGFWQWVDMKRDYEWMGPGAPNVPKPRMPVR